MIYCKFDGLQYEFSKTYRDKYGIVHESFYFLGKYLKESIHNFGRCIRDGTVKVFYHMALVND